MNPTELQDFFRARYGDEAVNTVAPEAFKVEPRPVEGETPAARPFEIYVMWSGDALWVRLMTPVTSAAEATPFLEQLMQANFEQTEKVRYALHEDGLWLVSQHRLERLHPQDLEDVVATFTTAQQAGLDVFFRDRIDLQIKQIILANKSQGQTLESTLQTLQHFYQEGMMGGLDQPAAERNATLEAWRYQLTRLWDTVDPAL